MTPNTRTLAAAAAILFGGPALAQQAPAAPTPQGPTKAELVAIEPEWTKVCANDPQTHKEVCYTARDFGTKADSPIMAFQLFDEKGSDEKLLRLLLPLGVQLKPGFRYALDGGAFESGGFDVCFPAGCFGETKLKRALVDSMKKGEKFAIVIKNQANAEVTLVVPLADFGKAYDGPPIDPKVLEERQKKLQEELKKRADAERQQQRDGKQQ